MTVHIGSILGTGTTLCGVPILGCAGKGTIDNPAEVTVESLGHHPQWKVGDTFLRTASAIWCLEEKEPGVDYLREGGHVDCEPCLEKLDEIDKRMEDEAHGRLQRPEQDRGDPVG